MTYHSRITSSLDAFETLSSAFVRSVPGALTHMRGGIHVDQKSLTGGVEGLGRLIKAYLSLKWIEGSMREWADDPVCPVQLANMPSGQGVKLINSSLLKCLINYKILLLYDIDFKPTHYFRIQVRTRNGQYGIQSSGDMTIWGPEGRRWLLG